MYDGNHVTINTKEVVATPCPNCNYDVYYFSKLKKEVECPVCSTLLSVCFREFIKSDNKNGRYYLRIKK